jgi:hypothetical protein
VWCWKPGQITLIPPSCRMTSSSATHALPKPRTRNTTGPCGAPSPRSKGRSTWRRAR